MQNKHKTLFVTDRSEFQQRWALEGAPSELDITMRRVPGKEEILALLPEMEFFISERYGVIDADMIAAGRKLRLIQRLGIQTWDIDLDAARRSGIPVCYLPVRTCAVVAEHVILQMLGLIKHVRDLMRISEEAADYGHPPTRCDENTFCYNWSGYPAVDALLDKTVGILGMGEIGLELARRLRPFEVRVLYHKRKQFPPEAEQQFGLTYATPEEIARQSDIVCALLPFGPQTEQSISTAFFAAMRPGAFFIQSGGSGTVDEDALAAALASGHLGGAAVDGFTTEPVPPDNPLIALARDPRQNLILTPHVAAGTVKISGALRAGDYINIKAILAGDPLRFRLV